MKYLYGAILLTVLYTAASCKKNPVAPPHTTDSVFRVQSITTHAPDPAAEHTESYFYDTKARLFKIEDRQANGTLLSLQAFERHQDILQAYHLHNGAGDKIATYEYLYQNKQPHKIAYTEFSPSTLHIANYTLEYDGEQLTKMEVANVVAGSHHYLTYTWTQGNITRVVGRQLPGNTWMWENRMEYDNHPNPFYHIGAPPNGHTRHDSKNNMTRVLSLNEDGSTAQDILLSYTYNTKGYPDKLTSRLPEGDLLLEQSFTYAFFPTR